MRSTAMAATTFTILAVASPGTYAQTLDDVAKAMGSGAVETIRYEGKGDVFGVGQSYRPGERWPRFNLLRMSRSIDYAKGILVDEQFVTQGENPPKGGARQPIQGEERRLNGVNGDVAFSAIGPFPLAAPGLVAQFQHDLWTSPHGIVKAAIADKAEVKKGPAGASFEIARPGRFKARAILDKRNLVVRVESVVNNPVLGDMPVVVTYEGYKQMGGAMVPSRIRQSAGGHPVLDLQIADAKVNAGAVEAPRTLGAAVSQAVKVTQAGDGIWFVEGGTHHSIAIEMKDHVVVFEGPLGDGRANPVIAEVKKAIPGKPIRYVVNTHHHFDHSGGLRAFAAEGATIVTHAMNKPYFEKAYAAPRTLAPDALSKSGKKAQFLAVGDKHVLTDGTRTLEIHRVKGNLHNDGLLIGWLPKEKILLVADAFSPRQPITATPATLNPFTTNLWDNLKRLKLDVATVLPIHGRMVKVDELRLEAGAK